MRGLRSIILAIILTALPVLAHAETRVALVIGNARYEHTPTLTNPEHDAVRVAQTLKTLGYELLDGKALLNLSQNAFRDALTRFAVMGAHADVAVIYYAGHGVEDGEHNYLIPVDANLATVTALHLYGVPLTDVVAAATEAGNVRIIILDACRTNDFPLVNENGGRGSGRGLRRENAPRRTLVAYSANQNQLASDGDGVDSPYTLALLRHIATPGLDARRMFDKVLEDVRDDPKNQGQEPMMVDELGDVDLSLAPGNSLRKTPPAPVEAPREVKRAPPDADTPEITRFLEDVIAHDKDCDHSAGEQTMRFQICKNELDELVDRQRRLGISDNVVQQKLQVRGGWRWP